LGIIPTNEGNISIDDTIIDESTKKSWIKKIGYVGQEVFMLDEDIASNVALGEEDVDESRLIEALENAGLGDFLKTLPDGIKHSTGEHGNKLSGGQKQRIGIARALYKNPDVLIMDEGTSALDGQIEKEIVETILEMNKKHNLTVIFVSHNPENLQKADQLITLTAF